MARLFILLSILTLVACQGATTEMEIESVPTMTAKLEQKVVHVSTAMSTEVQIYTFSQNQPTGYAVNSDYTIKVQSSKQVPGFVKNNAPSTAFNSILLSLLASLVAYW